MSDGYPSLDWLPLRGGTAGEDALSDKNNFSGHLLPFQGGTTAAQPFYCSGDPFAPGDVSRGLTLPPKDVANQGKPGGYVSGDCYAAAQCGPMRDVVTLESFGATGAYGLGACDGGLPPPVFVQKGQWTNGYNTNDHIAQQGVDDYGFNPSQDDLIVVNPPTKPDDPYFELQVTTVYVPDTSPAQEIWSVLSSFLAKREASVTKVNPTKCTMKADVFVDGVMCTLKVRIYSMGNRYAVEFQRKGGDTLTFNAAYKEASSYMSTQLSDVPEPTVAAHGTPNPASLLPSTPWAADGADRSWKATPPLMEVAAAPDGGEDSFKEQDKPIKLLLDLATTGNSLSRQDLAGVVDQTPDSEDVTRGVRTALETAQADAATMFAKISQEDGYDTATLCSAEVVSALQMLLNSESKEVQYPAAVALANSAMLDQAKPYFTEGVVSTLASRVLADDTCTLVKEKVAEAIQNAADRQGLQWQQSVREVVQNKLRTATKDALDTKAADQGTALLKEVISAFNSDPCNCTASSQDACQPGHASCKQTRAPQCSRPPPNAF